MIYLDNASTTKIDPRVFEEMEPFLKEEYGNPGSIHELGVRARKAVDLARERVAKAINASPEEIIFTSGGSEANNLAVKLATDFWGFHGKDKIISSMLEHDSMKRAIKDHASLAEFLPYYGRDELMKVLGNRMEKYWIASFMYVNNELGYINPINDIAGLCEELACSYIVDAVQALGSEEVDVKDIDCDFLSISSHKIHGPKGVGALYINKYLDKHSFKPIVWGGDNQEFGLRGGTENVAGIVGFGKACELINVDENKTTISKLRNVFLNGLSFDHKVNFNREDSKIISLTVPRVDAETLVLMLSSQGVCISAGSACKSLEQKPNEVLLAAGMSENDSRNTVRISLSCYNNKEEINEAARTISNCVGFLRKG